MFGSDGLLEHVRARFRIQLDRVAGIAYQEGMLYVAGLERKEGTFEAAFLESVMLQAEPEEKAQAVAEKTAALLSKKGWEHVSVVLALAESELVTLAAALPSAAPPEERQQMAHFEAARQLHRDPSAFFSFCRAQAGGQQTIFVLSTSHAEDWRHTFEDAGVMLCAMAAPPAGFRFLCEGRRLSWGDCHVRIADALLGDDGAFHGWDESFSLALYGAVLLVRDVPEEEGIFPVRDVQLSRWAYGRAALLVALVWLLLLLVGSAWDVYGWYAARQEARQQATELALLSSDAARMEEERTEEAWSDSEEQALRRLTAERSPAASVLVHLGTQNVPGVCLTELTMKHDGTAELKGQAVTFDALSDYVQGFERDRAFFPDGPLLLDSTRPESDAAGTIHFSLELRLPQGEEAEHADQGT